MAHVYVPQMPMMKDMARGGYAPRYDITPAEKYGTIIELVGRTTKPFNTALVVGEMRENLHHFIPGDYLLLIGNPVMIGLATTLAFASVAYKGQSQIRFLQWSGKERSYEVIDATIPFPERNHG